MVSTDATNAGAISVWHAYYLIDLGKARKRSAIYKKELEMEVIRQKLFSQNISRLRGMYFFESIQIAQEAMLRWGRTFSEQNLAEVELVGRPVISRYDSEWYTRNISSPDSSWMPKYLSGVPLNSNPLWELLIEGRGFILGTELRQRAYETVKRVWPQCLGMLELSRVAVEIGSDLGLVSPFLTTSPDKIRLSIGINFSEANDPTFLNKLATYNGPKNTADLNTNTDLVRPDLRDHFVEFPTSV